MESDAGLVIALALGAGVLCQLLARHLRIPSIVLLLAAGVLLGPDGVGQVEPRALGEGLHDLVGIAVAVILFEGALAEGACGPLLAGEDPHGRGNSREHPLAPRGRQSGGS